MILLVGQRRGFNNLDFLFFPHIHCTFLYFVDFNSLFCWRGFENWRKKFKGESLMSKRTIFKTHCPEHILSNLVFIVSQNHPDERLKLPE